MRSTIAAPTIIGHRKSGRPIYLIQGAEDNGGAGAGQGGDSSGNAGSTDSGGSTDGGTGGGADKGSAGKPAGKFDHLTDPAELRALAVRLDAEAANAGAKDRQTAKTKAAAEAQAETLAKVAEALGLKSDKADPAALEAELNQYRTTNAALQREVLVFRAATAPGAGVDVARLTDSRSFMARVETIDPTSDTAAADITAAIKAAIASDQSLKARQGAAGGSVQHTGGAGENTNPDLSKLHGSDAMAAAYAANAK